MDAALWWVLQQLHSMTEPRKIVVLISDGEPDDLKLTQTAIRAVKDAGMEVTASAYTPYPSRPCFPAKEAGSSTILLNWLLPCSPSCTMRSYTNREKTYENLV